MTFARIPTLRGTVAVLCAALTLSLAPVGEARAQIRVTAYQQAVAETAARDEELARFYRERDFQGVWTGEADEARRRALLNALATAPEHGLPAARFDPQAAIALLRAARTPAEIGRADVELSRYYLAYARAVSNGLLVPQEVVSLIKREVQGHGTHDLMTGITGENPAGFLRSLPPTTPEYQRLLMAKMELEALLPNGGFGQRVNTALRPGDSGDQVVRLRNRLMAMGYLDRTVTQSYDAQIQDAVTRFQEAMGLETDGVLGGATLEALNTGIQSRLEQIHVAMERERWMNNLERGDRHVWVNLTDFTAAIVDYDSVTFRTRSVIGSSPASRQTPEFSDTMDHMVINPSWYVPRSIIVGEYLPSLRANRFAVSHLQVIDSRGRVVPRGSLNTGGSFPYSMRQPPGPSNALGTVKFMFPNRWNIYLHDTPSQHLFSRTVRTFSHGCIRLDDPHDFAYELLSAQTDDPVNFFQSRLRSGAETRVELEEPVPVHLVYRTAFTSVDGTMNYRNDVYGRDGRIWSALAREGVAVGSVGG